MDTKFTPGPWADWASGKRAYNITRAQGTGTIARVGPWPDDAVNIANAHLIAAAPELYEALQRAGGILCSEHCEGEQEHTVHCNEFAAVLKKARGE